MKCLSKGFALIELMIVLTIVALLLTLALPEYKNYTIRAKVSESLSISKAAKLAVSETCQTDPTTAVGNTDMGYPANVTGTYVASVVIGGTCSTPTITLTTRETGATVAPVLVLTGSYVDNSGRMQWSCSRTGGEDRHVPAVCRSAT